MVSAVVYGIIPILYKRKDRNTKPSKSRSCLSSYGNNSPVTYDIEEVESGFNLTVEEQSILLPLEYMEGTDGLSSSKSFSGVYGVINGGPGYLNHSIA